MMLMVFYSRRLRRILSKPSWIVGTHAQVLFIVFGIGWAFSYDVDVEHEPTQKPYKSMMFITFMSTYSMVIQYLVVVPEYEDERPVLYRERDSGLCRLAPYLFAGFLTEIPRALVYSLELFVVGFMMPGVDVNLQANHAVFGVMMLAIGTGCFQGLISICCALTDDVAMMYNYVFVFIGSATMFGGQLIPYSNIPWCAFWSSLSHFSNFSHGRLSATFGSFLG
jgi:hypothetical protein